MNEIIKLEKINKQFSNQQVFENLSFGILESEILVILGRSGVGKSTLLKMLSKLDDDYQGEITYRDDVFHNLATPLPVVFQEFDQLFPWYTVKKNILIPTKYKKLDKGRKDILLKKFDEVVESVGLANSLKKFPSQLSGGMKQRTAIARALMCESKILLMDEPFGSLDFVMRRNLQKLMKVINKEYHKTIVFITHDINEAVFLGNRIMVLNDQQTFIDVSEINDFDSIKHIEMVSKVSKMISEI